MKKGMTVLLKLQKRNFYDILALGQKYCKRVEKVMLKLVKLEEKYMPQLIDMMDEWYAAGEKIVPYAIRKADYHDFTAYAESLEVKEAADGLAPDSTFFCLDTERDIFVDAVNIRHYLNEALLRNGGHMGMG